MRKIEIRLAVALAAAVGLWAAPALAASGRVVDPEGKPVVGARACLMVGEGGTSEGICETTDALGHYKLIGLVSSPLVRIVAEGFQPKTIAAVDQEAPVVLDRAATIKIRLVDAKTGKPISSKEINLVYTTGEMKGPFRANQAGVRIRSLPPGDVIPKAKAEGYRETAGNTVTLVAGRETEVELRLEPE